MGKRAKLARVCGCAIAAAVALVSQQSRAADTWLPIYSTDFSINPNWATNAPSDYYWDSSAGNFRATERDGSQAYATVPVSLAANSSFRLDFDVKLSQLTNVGNLKFGLYSSTRNAYMDQYNPPAPSKQLFQFTFDHSFSGVSLAGYDSTGTGFLDQGPSYIASANTPYHVSMNYDYSTRTATATLTNSSNGALVRTFTASGIAGFTNLTQLGFSKVGSEPANSSEIGVGAIDNVVLLQKNPTPTITPGIPAKNPGSVMQPQPQLSGHLLRWDATGGNWVVSTSPSLLGVNVNAPTIVIVHGWRDSWDASWVRNMATTLTAEAGNSSVNILTWDWRSAADPTNSGKWYYPGPLEVANEVSANGLNGAAKAINNGALQGVQLASDLQMLGIKGETLQLIAHSAGAAVIGKTASELKSQNNVVARLTTIDAPNLVLQEILDANGKLLPDLAKSLMAVPVNLRYTSANALGYVKPGDAKQVEVYFSDHRDSLGFGTGLKGDNVFNGRLMRIGITADHSNAPDWYSTTAGMQQRANTTQGFEGYASQIAGVPWSIVGNAPSPWKVGTFDETKVYPSASDILYDTPIRGIFNTPGQVNYYQPYVFAQTKEGSQFVDGWHGLHAEPILVDPDTGETAVRIWTASDGFLFKTITVPTSASFMTFDLKVLAAAGEDFLTVSFGDQVLFYQKIYAPTDGFMTIDPIFVGDLVGQTGELLFALNKVGSGEASSEILLENVSFIGLAAVPEPASLTLLSVGAVGLMIRRRRAA